MAKKAVEDRTFNVSVIGLSGTETVKGSAGVGKSCLCNRFINDTADKYFTDHISVLSPSDFSSRVINNDHFLYWGETTKTDEGNNFTFHVIEQTEFIDDVSFQAFKTGKLDPYQKRCVQTKVQSSEKFMYICKDQLGMETDSVYEQKVMPEGKLVVDGFVCCFDVSKVPNRSLKDHVDFVISLLNGAIKTKKPIVLVTTKTDDADEMIRREVEKIVSRKEYRNLNIPIVETSAHENVNVEQAFLVLAHLIDKSKRYRITPFNDAVKARKDLLDIATDAYRKLLRLLITDSKMNWNIGRKKLEKDSDFDHYVDLFGTESAKKLFRQHVKQLRDDQISKREKYFLTKLPDLLQHYLPDLNTIADRSWPSCIRHIRDHPDFDKHFKVVCGEGESWKTTQAFVDDYSETRIPFDMLSSSEAETCFRNHHNALQAEFRKLELKKSFTKALAENPQVIPGKTLDELEIFFLGKDCFVNLKPHEREQVFKEYQAELRHKARRDFQELLWERLDTFIHQRLFSDSSVHEDVRYITEDIQNLNDARYRRLDRLADERELMLINHLGFMESPSRERCFFQEDCAETKVQSVLETAAKSVSRESQRISNVPEVEKQLNLVLLGNEGLATDTCKEIRTLFPSDKFMYYDALYSVDYRPIEDDVTMEYNAFQTEDFKPHGCICIYSSPQSLEYLTNSLEVTIKPDLTPEGEDNPLKSIPVIIIQAPKQSLSEKDMLKLRDKGRDLAHVYHAEFIDVPLEEDPDDASQIELALLSLVRDTANGHHPLSDEPELRIAMCIMCGDDFSVDVPLGPLLNSSPTRVECENEYNSILIEANVDNSPSFTKRKIEVVVGSYHNFVASVFKEEEDDYQGFVLVYSPKRKASYYTMKALVDNLRRFSSIIPILILAVTDNGLASVFFGEENSKELIQEGNNLAENQGCMFMTTTANFQQQSPIYMSFFQEAWVKKDEIGESYYTDPNSPPYDEKIDKRPPAPLPKYDTYQTTKSSTSNSFNKVDLDPIYESPWETGRSLSAATCRDTTPRFPLTPSPSFSKPLFTLDFDSAVSESSVAGCYESIAYITVTSSSSISKEHDDFSLGKDLNNQHAVTSKISTRKSFSEFGHEFPSSGSNSDFRHAFPMKRNLSEGRRLLPVSRMSLPEPRLEVFPIQSRFTKFDSEFSEKSDFFYPLKPDLSPLKPELSPLKPEWSPLKPEFSPLKPDLSSLKPDLSPLKPEISPLKPELSSLKPEFSHSNPNFYQCQTELSPLAPDFSPLQPSSSSCLKTNTVNRVEINFDSSQSTEDSEPIYDQPHGYVHHSDSEHERPSSASPPSYRPPSPPNGELSQYQTVLPSMLRKRQGTNAAAREQCRRSFPIIEAESIRLQSYKSLEQSETDSPHYPFKKSYSMKLAMKEEEEAWALNEPRKQKKAATFPSDIRQNVPDNESWSEQSTAGSRNSDETVWAENDLYQRASFIEHPKPQVPPGRRTSGGIQAPIAQPEPDITLGDYASVRDAVNIPFPESDYALVGDALPAGKLQRILSQDRKKKKDGSDSDSEFSSLEREMKEMTIYSRVNRKPTPHKKKTKQKSSQDGQIFTIPVYVDEREKTHLGIRRRERSDSPSEGSEGTGDEIIEAARKKKKEKRRPLKCKKGCSPGGSESSGPGAFSPQLSDSDNFAGSPPAGHYREKTYESIEKYRELNTLPKGNMTSSLDGEYDLNDSGNWTLWKRKGRTKEEKRIKDEEKRKIKEEKEKQKEQQKMQKKKKKAVTESGYIKLQECQMSSNNPSLPQFVETCVEFLEEEGMNTEGIYRIPGNKQQVNDLQNKLNEDPGIDIHTIEDIQVNAVATVLKGFLNDTEPLIPSSLHDELLEAAGMPDKSPKLLALRGVLKKLYPTNYEVLKYFITHLNRVSQHSYKHNMDARNLALCLWPTIFRMDFKSYEKMATSTKYPPEIVQVLIEQCGFFFHGEDEICD